MSKLKQIIERHNISVEDAKHILNNAGLTYSAITFNEQFKLACRVGHDVILALEELENGKT